MNECASGHSASTPRREPKTPRPNAQKVPPPPPPLPPPDEPGREPAPAVGADGSGVAPPRREDRLFRTLREGVEIVREARQREIAAAHVPGRPRDPQALEVEDPALGDAERDRPREPSIEGVGRHPLEAILL